MHAYVGKEKKEEKERASIKSGGIILVEGRNEQGREIKRALLSRNCHPIIITWLAGWLNQNQNH